MASNNHSPVLEFNYDISCPYAYIASKRVEALAERTGAHLIWRPVLLGAIYRATAAPQGAAGSASDVFNPTKKTITSKSLHRTLQRHQIPLAWPPQHPTKTTAALRLIYHLPPGDRPALSKALFHAYWVEGRDVSDRSVLLHLVQSCGVSGAGVALVGSDDAAFEDPRDRKELERATADAVARGAPGVPAFWVADQVWMDAEGGVRRGRLYWGQDRMHFVEASLAALRAGSASGFEWGGTVQSLKTLVPRCVGRPSAGLGRKVRLEFWYDFSSPWAFLAWTQLGRIQRQFGEDLEISLRPFLLGALFKMIGSPMLPLFAASANKQRYMNLDHADWVRFWNAINTQDGRPDKGINFRWTSKFPIRTPTALRCAIVDPNTIPAIFRACWEDDIDAGNDDILAQYLTTAGFAGSDIIKQASAPEIKEKLRQNTQEAQDGGLCGTPSYRVFEQTSDGSWRQVGDVIWGQDETAIVEDLIAGWDEATSTAVANVGPEHKTAAETKPRL